MNDHELIVRLISAVAANITSNPNGTQNLNVSVAYEMVEKVLAEHRIIQDVQKRS
jgi:hypothetical protein